MKENHFDTQMDALIRAAVSQGGEPFTGRVMSWRRSLPHGCCRSGICR